MNTNVKNALKNILEVFIVIITCFIINYLLNIFFFYIEGSLRYTGKPFGLLVMQHGTISNLLNISFLHKRYLILLCIITAIGLSLLYIKKIGKSIIELFYKYRFIICLIVLVLGTLFELNGSSIEIYRRIFYNDKTAQTGDLIGISKLMRWDEFYVYTPLVLSQISTGFQKFNEVFGSSLKDVSLMYGAPINSVIMLFRIFMIGYFFLTPAKGLAFYWISRILVLFLASIEFGMLLTKNNKKYSIVIALLITFSPTIQWWFAVNGLVEMIVAAELGTVFLEKFLIEKNVVKKFIFLSLIYICIGTFIYAFYPAWMVICVYIFLPFIIWVFIDNWKDIYFKKIYIIPFMIISIIFLSMIFVNIIGSIDTIKVVLNTVYPGKRMETGGGIINKYIDEATSLFLNVPNSFDPTGNDTFIGNILLVLFLIGYLYIYKQNFKDKLTNLLMIFWLFLNIYIIIGVPDFIAKISFLGMSLPKRCKELIGLMNIFIMFRIITIEKIDFKKFNALKKILISICLSLLMAILTYYCKRNDVTTEGFKFIGLYRTIIIFVVYFIYNILVLNAGNEFGKKIKIKVNDLLIIFMIILTFLTGALVNPVRKGMNVILDNQTLKDIVEINKKDSGIWVTCNKEHLTPVNLLPALGISTLNATSIYPSIDIWKSIDVENKYEEVYNRYSSIYVNISNEKPENKFNLLSLDSFLVYLNADDIRKLNIKYVLINSLDEDLDIDGIDYEKIYESTDYKVFKFNY